MVSDLEMECLATWKDGSSLLLYTKVSSTDIDNKYQYRCVVSI